VLYSLTKKQLAPKAIINQKADPVVVVGAIIANIPMINQIDTKRIKTDDLVEVDAYNGLVKILERKER
jgi:predicted aconitase with swiveling domain